MGTENRHLSVRRIWLLLFTVILATSSIGAQDYPEDQVYSDEELETFVEAAFEVIPLQEESQLKMIDEIEERKLTVDKFYNILEVQQLGLEDSALTDEEMEAFEEAFKAVQEIQIEYHQLIIQVIEDAGISLSRYEEILNNYQQDTELQMRVNEIMEEKGYE